MTDWQVTAVTLNCPHVADEVTIIVNRDWTVKCTGQEKYTRDRAAGIELVKRSMAVRRTLECKGIDCSTVANYIEKIKNEEAAPPASAGDKL